METKYNISTKITNSFNKKEYIISTAQEPIGYFQTAVFLFENEKTNVFKPLLFGRCATFINAEIMHYNVVDIVNNELQSDWIELFNDIEDENLLNTLEDAFNEGR